MGRCRLNPSGGPQTAANGSADVCATFSETAEGALLNRIPVEPPAHMLVQSKQLLLRKILVVSPLSAYAYRPWFRYSQKILTVEPSLTRSKVR